MSSLALIITIVSSLGWAIFDATRKALTQKIPFLPLVWLLTLGQLPAYLVFVVVQPGYLHLSEYLLPGILAAIFNILGNICFLISVQKTKLSHSIPMLAFTPLFTTIFGSLFLGENLIWLQIFGIILVCLGAFFLNGWPLLLSFLKKEPHDKDLLQGIGLMIIVALLWSITVGLDKICLKNTTLAPHLLIQTLMTLLGLSPWFFFKRKQENLFIRDLPFGLLIFSAAAVTIAFSTQLVAIQEIYVGLFEALKRSVGITASVILGRIFFQEEISWQKISSIGLLILGVVLTLLF